MTRFLRSIYAYALAVCLLFNHNGQIQDDDDATHWGHALAFQLPLLPSKGTSLLVTWEPSGLSCIANGYCFTSSMTTTNPQRRTRSTQIGAESADRNSDIEDDENECSSDANNNRENNDITPSRTRQKYAQTLNSEIHRLRKKPNGIPLAERRLDSAIEMMLEAKSEGNDIKGSVQFPDVVSFNAVISSYAKKAHKDKRAASKAERVLQKMKDLSKTFPHLLPTTFTYNAVMEAYLKHFTANQKKKRGHQNMTIHQGQDSIWRVYYELQASGLAASTYTWNLLLASATHELDEWKSLERWATNFLEGKTQSTNSSAAELIPDRQTYNTLLKIYADHGNFEKADMLLWKLLQWNQCHPDEESSLELSKVWYHCVFKAMAASETPVDDLEGRVDRLLQDMTLRSNAGLQPDTTTFNHVLNVHALTGNIDAATALLEEMERMYNSNPDELSCYRPDCVSYTTVIKAFSTVQQRSLQSKDSLKKAEEATRIFERMQSRTDPNIVTYNTLLHIWVHVGTRDALQKAESLLRESRYPDSVSYSTLIHGWSRSRLPESGYRAQNLFNEMLQLPPSRQRGNFSITTLCNSVIAAYARSGEKVAPKRVEMLMSQLEGRFLNGDMDARPDKTTFLCMFDTYAKAGIANAEDKCETLLNRMNHYKDVFGLDDLAPDRAVYNAILNSLAKSQQTSAVDKAEEILTMMETSPDHHLQPDIVTYATVLDCYTKCGEKSSQRAEELLRFVEGTYRRGAEVMKPNAVFYSAYLQAWAKSASIEGAEKAEELLRRNIALYERGHDYAKPHAIVYNAVMDAVARSGMQDSGARAEQYLEEMESLYQSGDEDMKPSRRSFNAVILAYRKEGDASGKAEELLYRMESISDTGRHEVRPNVVSYNNVIGAIVEDSKNIKVAADRAQALLDRMEERGVRPDGRSYSLVIEAWLRRNDEKGHALAEVMLNQFWDKVEESKKKKNFNNDYLYEDAVRNVIDAYRKTSNNDTVSAR